jgi:hypothetical protein
LALEPVVRALDDPAREEGALLALDGLPVSPAAATIRGYCQAATVRALRYQRLGRSATATGPPGEDRWLLLGEALREQALANGRRALHALGLLAGRDALMVAIENLEARDPAQRATALESLEAVDRRWREYVRPLLPLWDLPESNSADGAGGAGPGLWDELLSDPDGWVRACAALAAGRAPEDAGLRRQLQRLAESDQDPIVRETAGRAAGPPGEAAMDTLATLSTMERILFLRRVPLFADLSPADLKQVAAATGERLHADGDIIAQEGDPGEELYIITSGAVRVRAKWRSSARSRAWHRSWPRERCACSRWNGPPLKRFCENARRRPWQ